MDCVFGVYCNRHGFIHGAEAEELRGRLQDALPALSGRAERIVQRVLDDTDARDSLAWLERRAADDAAE